MKISINENHVMIINDTLFNHGELSARRFSSAVNFKYVTKRMKKPNIRFYLYKFKKLKTTLMSNGFRKPIDNCSRILICLKDNKNIDFDLDIYGIQINKSTKFDDIYQLPKLRDYIDRSFYFDEKNPSKSELRISIKFYSIYLIFDAWGNSLEEVYIGSYWDDNIVEPKKT